MFVVGTSTLPNYEVKIGQKNATARTGEFNCNLEKGS